MYIMNESVSDQITKRMTMQEFADTYGVYVAKDADDSVRCFSCYPDYDEVIGKWVIFGEEHDSGKKWRLEHGYSIVSVARIDGCISDAMRYSESAIVTPESANPMLDVFFARFHEVSYHLAEMADTWPHLRADILNNDYNRWLHLLKMFYYRTYTGCHDGWIASVRKGAERIKKLSSTKRFPKFEVLYDLLWERQEDILDDFQRNYVPELRDDYPKLPPIKKIDYQGVRRFFAAFLKWECEQLHAKGGINQVETKRKIYSLLGIKQ